MKKYFSKLTEKTVKKRGISLSKHWICAYKFHLLGSAPKAHKKSHSERNATIHKIISNYIQNSILSKKIEYSQVKSLMNTQYGPSGETWTHGLLTPSQARYQLRHTRIFNLLDFSTQRMLLYHRKQKCQALF